MSHSKITGKIAEQKLDKMIEGAIKAGARLRGKKARLSPLASESVSEIIELLQVAYEDLDYWSAMAAFEALARQKRPEGADYVELFLREINRI